MTSASSSAPGASGRAGVASVVTGAMTAGGGRPGELVGTGIGCAVAGADSVMGEGGCIAAEEDVASEGMAVDDAKGAGGATVDGLEGSACRSASIMLLYEWRPRTAYVTTS